MDVIRSCYSSNMKLRADSDELTPGRWHFCKPGAKVIPYEHAFGSRNWDSEHGEFPPVGEQGRSGYSKGKPLAAMDGQHFCGGPEVWAQGATASTPALPVGPDGVPLCCGAPPVPPPPVPRWQPAGLLIGGSTEERVVVPAGPGRRGGLSSGGSSTARIALGTGCPSCVSGSTAVYDLVVSGVSGGSCGDCEAVLNGSFRLLWTDGCGWASTGFDFCGFAGVAWFLDASTGQLFLLVSLGDTPLIADFSPFWDCLSPVTVLGPDLDSGHCDWSSAVLTITAVPSLGNRAIGGHVLGGRSVEVLGDLVSRRGGLLLGSSADSRVPLDQHQGGGILSGGSSVEALPVESSDAGGLLLGGRHVEALFIPDLAGGLLLGGSSVEGLLSRETGGQLLGGNQGAPVACSGCTSGFGAASYTVDFTGTTDGTCDCSQIRGTLVLWGTGACSYASEPIMYCRGTGSSGTWTLGIAPSLVQLVLTDPVGPSTVVAYHSSASSWDCLTPLVLDLQPFANVACGWPLSVTVNPNS